MDYDNREYRERDGVVERYNWMGWLFSIVGCFIVALLVLMFLDMSNRLGLDNSLPESQPAVQVAAPAIDSTLHSPTYPE